MTEPAQNPKPKEPPALDRKICFSERLARADIPKALEIRKRTGVGNPPMTGDELPGWQV